MAELNAILAKIEQASLERSQAVRARAEMEWNRLDADATAQREDWKAEAFAKLQRESDRAYAQGRAAMEQDFKKKLLRDRRTLVNNALGNLSLRLRNTSQEEFQGLLQHALAEMELGAHLSIQFGAESPVDVWTGWMNEYMKIHHSDIVLDVLPEEIPRDTGFVLRSDAVSYRLMGAEIIAQFLEENGGEIEKRLFADGMAGDGERP